MARDRQTLNNTGSCALPEAPTSHQITSEIHPLFLVVTDLCPTFLGSCCPQAVATSPAPTRPLGLSDTRLPQTCLLLPDGCWLFTVINSCFSFGFFKQVNKQPCSLSKASPAAVVASVLHNARGDATVLCLHRLHHVAEDSRLPGTGKCSGRFHFSFSACKLITFTLNSLCEYIVATETLGFL